MITDNFDDNGGFFSAPGTCRSETDVFSKNNGFTFLEVMIALSIVAIVFVSVYKLNARSTLMADAAGFYTTASLLAKQKLSEIEIGQDEQRFFSTDHGDFGEDFPNLSYDLQIEEVYSEILENVSDDFKKITITVSRVSDDATYRIIAYRLFIP